MQYIWMLLVSAGIVAADQLTKLWIVDHLKLGQQMAAIPGIFRLTYTQNTGAAFSSFQGMQWLFALIFAVFTVLILWEFSKKKMPVFLCR